MNRRTTISTLPEGVCFRPRYNGCRGSESEPVVMDDRHRGICPECRGLVNVRGDGLIRNHQRKDGVYGR